MNMTKHVRVVQKVERPRSLHYTRDVISRELATLGRPAPRELPGAVRELLRDHRRQFIAQPDRRVGEGRQDLAASRFLRFFESVGVRLWKFSLRF